MATVVTVPQSPSQRAQMQMQTQEVQPVQHVPSQQVPLQQQVQQVRPQPGGVRQDRPQDRRRHGRRRRWLSRALFIGLGVAGAGGLAYAWRPTAMEVDTDVAKRAPLIVAIDEVGKTRVRDRYVVAAPLAGSLLRIELRAGDPVTQGGVLARITPMESPLLDPRSRTEAAFRSAGARAGEKQAQAAIARAEAASLHANDELERTKKLVSTGSLAPDALTRATLEARLRSEELASAKFGAQVAAHEAAMAAATLARFESPTSPAAPLTAPSRITEGFNVPSPAAGHVLRVISQSAGPVQPGTPLVEIGDPSALEVVTEVLSADAVRITPGAQVVLERWGGNAALRAHVRRVEPSGFTRLSALGVEEQRVPVVIDLDEPRNVWASLGDGFRIETRIIVEEKRDVVQIPLGAVFRHDGKWATYALEKGTGKNTGTVRRTPVVLGARSESAVEVLQGLSEGTTVIVHPSERVKDGTKATSR